MVKYFILLLILVNTSANNLIKDFNERILPQYRSCFNTYYNYSSYKVNYCFIKGETDELFVISPGRNESGLKYMFLADEIFEIRRPNILVIDHINQGFSSRSLENSTKMHIDDFNDFFNSTEELILNIRKKWPQIKNINAFGHSMGAYILFEVAKKERIFFSNLYLSAPMFSINTYKIPKFIIRTITSTLRNLGFAKHYAITQHEHKIREYEDINYFTHSKERFEFSQYVYKKVPEIKSSGSTYAWVDEVFQKTKFIKRNLEKLKLTNIYIFQGGNDRVVDNDLQSEVCNLLSNCKLIISDEAFHDFIHEKDEIRSRIIEAIKAN